MAKGLCPPFDAQAYREGHLTPVYFGSALNNFGVRELLRGVAELAPPPRPQPADPRPIDPEEPEVSYIKRLVGLPGETIRIAHGDIYVKAPGQSDFVLARKPLRHQSAMQINVYDDRYRPRALAERDEWRRWRSASGWKQGDPSTSAR